MPQRQANDPLGFGMSSSGLDALLRTSYPNPVGATEKAPGIIAGGLFLASNRAAQQPHGDSRGVSPQPADCGAYHPMPSDEGQREARLSAAIQRARLETGYLCGQEPTGIENQNTH